MRAVDTNVLVRLLTGDDPNQTAAAESFVAPGAWVSHLVLAETTWVLSAVYRVGPAAIATAVDMLLNHEALTLQDADVARAALQQYRATSGMSFSDCLVLEVARKNGHLPLGTFDRQLARLDGAQRL
ncbi:MAG: type II toxin-antitoxin system VapC family toxin [Candidatus Rokubacteria bacterium]|nr:type II toxin-antitoxin system VapC family toxin [Candidatus Rokubacteria bacterium]